ncbi:MAG: MASE1 domain-containing protein [Gammaproteobacteria bacterium]|nr:MASE1 domain-containing protein [Gammaproteobacteria bacterium]
MAVAYFLAAKLGLAFASVNPSATAIWPPTGISLAALLILGIDVWPAILVGAFLANVTVQGTVATSLLIGVGNTLEAVIGALLVNRFAHGRLFFLQPRDIVKFAGLAAVLSTVVSATTGVTTLAVAGYASWAEYGHIWLTWWLGDSAGDLVVAPFLILWATLPAPQWRLRWMLETAALIGGLSLVAMLAFDGLTLTAVEHFPIEYLCVPFLFWAAFRLGRRCVATCVLVMSFLALNGTLLGFGPFARATANESLLLLQGYLAVKAITMLAAAAVVWQLRQAEKLARSQAASDELTGLANYRHIMETLQAEIRRAQRAGRPFAALLLDMDGLKTINDRLGHLVGNRALCRIGNCLRTCCRATDMPARFGGDEFAVILPETSAEGARQLAERIRQHLSADAEYPPLSVSIGVALYPHDGPSAEKLLSVADRELYQQKAAKGVPGPPTAPVEEQQQGTPSQLAPGRRALARSRHDRSSQASATVA